MLINVVHPTEKYKFVNKNSESDQCGQIVKSGAVRECSLCNPIA